MKNSTNSIGALANRQKKENMQRHMRGYGNGKNDIHDEEKEYHDEQAIFTYTFLHTYHDYITHGYFKEFKALYEINGVEPYANYLSKANEALLETPDFLYNNKMVDLTYSQIFMKPKDQIFSSDYLSKIGAYSDRDAIFYIAGKTEDEPNTIRFRIVDYKIDYRGPLIYKLIVDYKSDGNIIISDAEKYVYNNKTVWDDTLHCSIIDPSGLSEKCVVDIAEMGVSVERIKEMNDYIQQIFEAANLKTNNFSK